MVISLFMHMHKLLFGTLFLHYNIQYVLILSVHHPQSLIVLW